MVARQPQLDNAERRAQQALDLLMRLLSVPDAELGQRVGLSREAIRGRRAADTRIRPGDIDQLAAALDIPADLFRKSIPEILAWFGENPARSIRQYGCIDATPAQTAHATAA